MFLDTSPQSIMQVDIWLYTVDPIDLGDVVTRQLIAATGSDFEDRTVSFGDEIGDICL